MANNSVTSVAQKRNNSCSLGVISENSNTPSAMKHRARWHHRPRACAKQRRNQTLTYDVINKRAHVFTQCSFVYWIMYVSVFCLDCSMQAGSMWCLLMSDKCLYCCDFCYSFDKIVSLMDYLLIECVNSV